MSGPSDFDATPVTSTRQLAEYLAAGIKPRSGFVIGTEHEKFGFRRADRAPLPYDGPAGIHAMLDGIAGLGWEPVLERGKPIALRKGRASVSLEPGGQFELSGAPLATLHEAAEELDAHLNDVRTIAGKLGVGFAPLGFHPELARADVPWMPKGRYAIMRRYMPLKGSLGLDMMLRTCTVQVNLDFDSEADMVAKFRLGLALQPVATALFANSPFTEGRPNGMLSYRSHVWTDTDPDRCGIPPVVFEEGFGFERYAEWVLDVPMYFVYRDGSYIDVAGQSFRDFIAGRLPGYPGQVATMGDWADHITTVFTEVRLKRYLEMRGADAGSRAHLMALPALWAGLLYDPAAQKAAEAFVRGWTVAEISAMRRDAPRLGLKTPFRKGTLADIARAVLAIAADGLRARGIRNARGEDESVYLQPLEESAFSGLTPADRLLDRFRNEWGGSTAPVLDALAI
ncbi:MAG: glutamate--cysteine ligase [Alphaproteobacteria bacterium]|nr:glutamate--cysteine ligase [Alphaproteobacteria bacterium]